MRTLYFAAVVTFFFFFFPRLFCTCPYHMVNIGPVTAEIDWRVLRTLANFNGFRVLASLLHPRRSTEVNHTFHDLWPSPAWAGTLYIHFWSLLFPNGILLGAKFTLRPSLAFSYSGGVTARHSRSGHQPNCGVEQTAPPIFGRAAITLGIGHILVM